MATDGLRPSREDEPPVHLSREGETELYLPDIPPHRGPARRARVFYNPAMTFDRDLNVAFARALRASGRAALTGWEMLGATGVRGLRLVRETDLFAALMITEGDRSAIEVLERNVAHLGLSQVRTRQTDARSPAAEGPFDYIDLDPYGSPLPYLDSLLRSARLPAVVGVTATDLMVLAGAVRGACETRYGARPVHGRLAPEGGLRIVLARLAHEARARGAAVRPLLSYVHDHHVRTYAELLPLREGPASDPVRTLEPPTWDGPPLGPGASYGPLWVGPLFDRGFVERLEPLPSASRPRELAAFIARVKEEARVDRPFYYEPNEIAHHLRLSEPPALDALLHELRRRGAGAVRAHPRPSAFRTDAPRALVEDVARSLVAPR